MLTPAQTPNYSPPWDASRVLHKHKMTSGPNYTTVRGTDSVSSVALGMYWGIFIINREGVESSSVWHNRNGLVKGKMCA